MPRKKKIEEVIESDVATEEVAVEETLKRKVRDGVFKAILSAGSADGINFEVKPYLEISDTIGFVDYVTDMVFTGNIYRPSLFDYAINTALIIFYTDIDIPEDDDAAEKINEFISTTDVISTIIDNMNDPSQYHNLVIAVQANIDNKNDFINHYNHTHDEMFENISILVRNVNEWIDKLGGMLERKIKKLRIDPESVKDIQALSRRMQKLDEKEIIKEIVEHSKEKSENDNKVVPFTKKDK